MLIRKLILFTRFPVPGTTKTRLIPALGADNAAKLQRKMTEQTVYKAKAFCRYHGAALEIHYHGGNLTAMSQWLGPNTFKQQPPGTIGERMEKTFAQAFTSDLPLVVIVGTDCPGLTEEILAQAFSLLEKNDLVIGPALDGGYYLIGLSRPKPYLFHTISWGTPSVLKQTLAKAKNLKVSQLIELNDIDRPEDLVHFNYHSYLQ